MIDLDEITAALERHWDPPEAPRDLLEVAAWLDLAGEPEIADAARELEGLYRLGPGGDDE